MIIDGREIGPHQPPYIIAEISCNHNGSLDNALKLIKAAKDAGADAVKFQAYMADTITIDHDGPDFTIKSGPWAGRKLYELYASAGTPFDWFPTLFSFSRATNITPLASVFDKSSVDLLEEQACPAYKIASMEITDVPLIEYVAKTGKPVIISTGMATQEEQRDALMPLYSPVSDYTNAAILACVSGYPTETKNGSLFKLRELLWQPAANMRWIAGISDHTLGWDVPIAAAAMGACIIEKHLMLGNEHTEDYDFSLVPLQFAYMTKAVRNIWLAQQPPQGDPEEASRQLRRSLYVVKDMQAGEPFTEENVRSIRPAYGLAPGKLSWVLTKSAAVDLKRGTALSLDHIS